MSYVSQQDVQAVCFNALTEFYKDQPSVKCSSADDGEGRPGLIVVSGRHWKVVVKIKLEHK